MLQASIIGFFIHVSWVLMVESQIVSLIFAFIFATIPNS
jgi:hypothetical protein